MPIDHQILTSLPDTVRARELDEWVNWHRNVKQPLDAYFDIANQPGPPKIKHYRGTASNIQALLKLAIQRDASVRPFGGTWSFSDIAANPDWMIDTAYLNWVFPVDDFFLNGRHANRTDELFLVQAGIKISQINRVLEKQFNRSLNTSGASNGQTIAGAIATGTHGSALEYGAIHNHIVGIHLITGPDQQVWLERESDPAVTNRFTSLIGADPIRDDNLFNAALVNLGALGFVAGLLLDTVPLFRLQASRDWHPYDIKLQGIVDSLDFSNFKLPNIQAGTVPYFFLAVINPFDLQKASITAMLKKPYADEPIDYAKHDSTGPGYELLGAIGALTDAIGASIPSLVNVMAKQQLKPFSDKQGTLGETFDFTTPRTNAAGASLGVALTDTSKTLEILIDEQASGPKAPVVFATRFVQNSGATLEFTQHQPTCVVDIDGVHSDRTLDFMQRCFDRLETEGIHYTQHWGKINNYNSTNLKQRYGDTAVSAFLGARSQLLPDPSTRRLFSSPFIKRIGFS